jgi:hypothetical protein
MDRVPTAMSLIHDLAVKLEVLRSHKAADVTHYNIRSLSGNDIFLHSWNESYVAQSTMWNNSDTQLFWITTRSVRLDGEVVVLVLTV